MLRPIRVELDDEFIVFYNGDYWKVDSGCLTIYGWPNGNYLAPLRAFAAGQWVSVEWYKEESNPLCLRQAKSAD